MLLSRVRPLYLRLPAAALIATLAACGSGPSDAPAPAAVSEVASKLPQDPALAKIYSQTCQGCHSNPASGAPLSGDVAAWAPRLAQGESVLLDHTLSGYKGMPPLGSCMDCSEADFLALIQFMSEG
ncbi:MAG: c-type cytochrome [Nevskiales bacterium]|nr:c-type cytochrome [Nevskiales bacterium]